MLGSVTSEQGKRGNGRHIEKYKAFWEQPQDRMMIHCTPTSTACRFLWDQTTDTRSGRRKVEIGPILEDGALLPRRS